MVKASEFRIVATGDGASYVKMSRDVESSDVRMIASQGRVITSREIGAQQLEKYARSQQGIVTIQNAQARALDYLNGRVQTFNAGQNQMAAANDNAASGMHLSGMEAASLAGHLRTALAAAYLLSPAFRQMINPAIAASFRAIGPAAVSAGGMALSALTPVLAFISRLALPIWLAVEAWKAMNQVTELGAQRLKEFSDISSNAAAGGVSTEFLQRMTASAKTLEVGLGDVLKKFKEITTEKLGGSDFEKRLKELSEAATASSSGATNFAGNPGVAAFKNAATTEDRWRAVTVLITKAMESGERLAALDLAAKFLPPEMLERLRANGNLLKEMQTTADKTKEAEIFTPEQIGYGIEIKRRLDQANETIENRLKPLQKDLTDLGLQYQESWVKLVEVLAGAVTAFTSIYGWVKSIGDIFAGWGNADWIKTLNRWMDSKGLTSLPEGSVNTGLDWTTPVGDSGDTAMTAARAKLAGLLRDTKAVQAAMLETTNTAYKVVGDKSQEPAKAAAEARSAWDRAVDSASKNIAIVEAEAAAVGKTTGEHARLRVEAQLTEAAQRAGIEITGKAADKYKELGERAQAAAQALALARVQNQSKFDRATMFLSPEDLKAAQELRGIYDGDDIPKALQSAEAAQLRFNQRMSTAISLTTDLASNGLKDFRNSIMSGASAFDSLKTAGGNALNKISDKLIEMATQQLVLKAFGSLGTSLFSSILGGGIATPSGGTTSGVGVYSADQFNPIDAAVRRSGGLVGESGGPRMFVHPAYFENAPRFASGGRITDDGVPIIAHRGERILNRQQTAAYDSGGGVTVHAGDMHINIQGDASEKTVALIRQEVAKSHARIPAIVVKTVTEAKSRRFLTS